MARRKAEPADAVAKAAHEAAVANIILHFDTTYISNPSRLGAFQQLCKDLDVEVGASLKQCKKVFSVPLIAQWPHADSFVTECEASQRQHPRFRPCPADWRRRERYQVLLEGKASSGHARQS
jgi:hypothetical protein